MRSVPGVNEGQIASWALIVRGWFRTKNAPFLPLGELEDDDRIAYSTIADQFRNTCSALRLVQEEVGTLRENQVFLQAEIRQMGRDMTTAFAEFAGEFYFFCNPW
jgi:hypothetical protein